MGRFDTRPLASWLAEIAPDLVDLAVARLDQDADRPGIQREILGDTLQRLGVRLVVSVEVRDLLARWIEEISDRADARRAARALAAAPDAPALEVGDVLAVVRQRQPRRLPGQPIAPLLSSPQQQAAAAEEPQPEEPSEEPTRLRQPLAQQFFSLIGLRGSSGVEARARALEATAADQVRPSPGGVVEVLP